MVLASELSIGPAGLVPFEAGEVRPADACFGVTPGLLPLLRAIAMPLLPVLSWNERGDALVPGLPS
jgi:hypothetical protein